MKKGAVVITMLDIGLNPVCTSLVVMHFVPVDTAHPNHLALIGQQYSMSYIVLSGFYSLLSKLYVSKSDLKRH